MVFQDPGTYHIILRVIDAGGNAGTAELDIEVLDRTPPALTIRGEDRFYKGGTGRFSFDISDNGNASKGTAKARWSLHYLDGPSPQLIDVADGVEAVFRFEIAGNYTITLNASDASGNNASVQMGIFIEERPDTDGNGDESYVPIALIAMVVVCLLAIVIVVIITALVLRRRGKEIVEEEWVDEDDEDLDYDEETDDEEVEWGDWE